MLLSCFRLDFNGFYTEKLEALSAEKAMMETSVHSTESGAFDMLILMTQYLSVKL